MAKKDSEKKKRAKVCIGCESNQEGYCIKHKSWCGKVNYICLGIKNPYEYKTTESKPKKTCKKCVYYVGTDKRKTHKKQGGYTYHLKKYCKAFKMNIHSTLNATKCKKYKEKNRN
jgi:hypothetical protein